jgi:YesN/AraC family two-component response regulator
MLEHGCYTVLEASGGSQAIEIAQQHHGPIHLLLTDVVMPRMNGPAVAERLMPMRSGMSVIYMSGYTGFAHGGVPDTGANFLPKPVTGTCYFVRCMKYLTRRRNRRLPRGFVFFTGLK